MRALLGILVSLFVVMLGVGGYYIYDTMIAPDKPASASSQSSDQAGQSSTGPRVGVTAGSTQKPAAAAATYDALAAAQKANRDTVAWLRLPGCEINDSVLQAMDNSYYERRDERKNNEVYGCYFFDYECPVGAREVLAPNTVIYGHTAPNNDPDGKRFSKLYRFLDRDFARANPVIELTTEEERLEWEIFAVFYTDISFDYIRVLISGEEMKQIADHGRALSIFDYGIETTPEDRILTLSTCSLHEGNDGTQRFVVMARLLPEGTLPPTTANVKKKS